MTRAGRRDCESTRSMARSVSSPAVTSGSTPVRAQAVGADLFAVVAGEQVARDAEDPPPQRPPLRVEGVPSGHRLGEGLAREVLRDVGRHAPGEVAVDVGVVPVEDLVDRYPADARRPPQRLDLPHRRPARVRTQCAHTCTCPQGEGGFTPTPRRRSMCVGDPQRTQLHQPSPRPARKSPRPRHRAVTGPRNC